MFNLLILFFGHIDFYWEKVTFYEKISHNITFEPQILCKISTFNATDRSIEILKNSCIFKNFN